MSARPGIPTLYKGIEFRSRLEARWAAFFDMLGWAWEFEPFDTNGWIPDFMLTGFSPPMLVEVKPASSPEECRQHIRRIENSGWGGPAWITTMGPVRITALAFSVGIASRVGGGAWNAVVVGCACAECPSSFGLLEVSESPPYRCHSCGRSSSLPNVPDISGHWASSVNATKWRP